MTGRLLRRGACRSNVFPEEGQAIKLARSKLFGAMYHEPRGQLLPASLRSAVQDICVAHEPLYVGTALAADDRARRIDRGFGGNAPVAAENILHAILN